MTHSKSTNEPSGQNEALSPLNPSRSWSDNHSRGSIDYVDTAAPAEIAYTTVPELFVNQVAKTPHAEALVSETRRLTYAELDSRVEFIFNLLVNQQVGAGEIVAVLLDRSEELVATLLAVQRAGAAYLPVDTEYPAERIKYMLGNSKPACVVSTSKYEYIYRSITEASTIILLDAEEAKDPGNSGKTSQPPHSSETWLPHPLDAAYVIYTSGSTGRPKGVVVSQLAIANHLLWMQRNYSLVESDRVLQKTPAGFDVSVWEFFWPLIVGATLVVASPQAHKAPNELVEIIQRERVTTIHFVPSMLELFLDETGILNCTSLRRVFASGEALPVETLRRFSNASSATLYNLYGPTEAAVDATAWECSVSDFARPRVPIGFPVAHTGVHVLDDQLQPVASGAEGELYLTGVQIARCYLDNPELTAERFVACPFVAGGERMYRTGDLVKYNQDGALDFIGRADTQLKINGVRVEPGEVESVLREYPGINQAVVVANHNAAGVPGLAAFLTVNESDAPSGSHTHEPTNMIRTPENLIAAVRGHAAQLLPTSMVPVSMTIVPEIPLTVNGKIDRVKLSTDYPISSPSISSREPRSECEKTLCELVRKTLGLIDIGPEDDFFALGGASLSAIVLVSAIIRAFNIPFKLRTLLKHPRISDLALCIEREMRNEEIQ